MTLISGRKVGGSGRPFNTFFRWGWAFLLLAGCASTPEAKQAKQEAKDVSVIRLYTEVRDPSMGGTKASLPRSNPMEVVIDKEPFADERDVVRADVVSSPGGFAIRVELTMHGRMTLEGASVSHAGQRLVAFGQWAVGKENEETVQRWLAAPVMRTALRSGIVVFTPDCDREEADRFVRGLNNVAIKLKNQPKPKKVKPAETKPEPEGKKKKKKKEKEPEPASRAQEYIKAYEDSRK